MAKVLLTHSYFLRLDPKQWKQQQPYPPLGTLYAAAYLRQAGYSVALFDTMFSEKPEEIIPVLENEKPDYVVLFDDGFNYLSKMCLTNMRAAGLKVIRYAKSMGCKTIVSSSDSTDHKKEYLNNGSDFIIVGEGEQTLLKLLNHIEAKGNNTDSIAGIAYMNGDTIQLSDKREVIRNLDTLPMPAWDLINIAPYKDAWHGKWDYFSMNMVTTRGCPFKCNWCAKPIYGNRYNSRSPENVIEELEYLKKYFAPDHIWFCDDIFGLKPGWVKTFAALMVQKNLRMKFKIQCRADLLLQADFIADLALAGCESVWIGAESGSQKILDSMDKGIKVEQVYGAAKLLKRHGIKPALFLQFGYPGETLKDIGKTLKMLFDLNPNDLGVSVSYPLPGTVFYEKVKSELKKKTNWTDSDDLALMFKGTFHPSFYKLLHRFVHKLYRSKQYLTINYML